MTYKVIKDTREQKGWTFRGMENKALKSGDYSLVGSEEIFAIERKGSVSEYVQNITQGRFYKELARLDEYTYSFLILEFELRDLMMFPINSGIPRRIWGKLRMTPQSILRKTTELMCQHSTQFIFAGKYGKQIATSIFKRVYAREIK